MKNGMKTLVANFRLVSVKKLQVQYILHVHAIIRFCSFLSRTQFHFSTRLKSNVTKVQSFAKAQRLKKLKLKKVCNIDYCYFFLE